MKDLNTIPPDLQALLQAWLPFKKVMGVTAVHNRAEYLQAKAQMERLLDTVGDNESHPLVEILDYLADQIKAYEDEYFPIPQADPRAVLQFLMAQHQLNQGDLRECAPQSRISDILSGRRAISKAIAKRLAQRFQVHADVFL